MALAHTTILEHKAFSWQLLAGSSIVTGQANQNNCAEYFHASCSGGVASPQNRALIYYLSLPMRGPGGPVPDPDHMVSLQQDLVSFLLVRGPYAWLGTGWLGCGFQNNTSCCSGDGTKCHASSSCSAATDGFYDRPISFDVDYGEPQGMCRETPPGSSVFTRNYTKARISMDCKAFEGTITMLPKSR